MRVRARLDRVALSGNIFRLLTGQALIAREGLGVPTWGVGGDMGKAAARLGLERAPVKELERPVDALVSETLGAVELLWIGVDDAPGSESLRGYIERNAIALLSNYQHPAIDPPSTAWLGRFSDRERVRQSGLWNSNHVDDVYDAALLGVLEGLIDA